MQGGDTEFDSGEDEISVENFAAVPDTNGQRFQGVRNLILRAGSGLTKPGFEPCEELLTFMQNCPILVVGAGGLGCELLKNLALMGFQQISVIDMDTIDLSNLNRQFLFRQADIGQSKAICAANFINARIPKCKVTPYYKKIEDFDEDFYRGFKIIVCGLDSVVARRWINGMVLSLLSYDNDGHLDPSTIIPIIDGGAEGFKGNVRVITPGITACLECSIELYPPAVNFPMCTIAHTPRLPEHCIEYAKIFLWPKEGPFGGVEMDGDDPQHINWIFTKAEERAREFGIPGVTYRLTLGVIKHIIPSVASTNAIIAAACASEVFKTATFMYATLDNYFMFNNSEGCYGNVFQIERNENCLACSQKPQHITVKATDQFKALMDFLKESNLYQMRSPGITATIGGKSRTLYMPNIPFLEEQTRGNLTKTIAELGIKEGQELVVVDSTSPTAKIFKVHTS